MTFYFFTQQEKEAKWLPALADERANILRSKKPALCTVLDVDSAIDENTDKSIPVRYRGPLYWDIDDLDLETSINSAQRLLTLIKEKGVHQDTLQIFLSGKKGFHVLMDSATFLPKVPLHGTVNLPDIYKVMVYDHMYIDGVDLAVYSKGRGRMLRCVNVDRGGGIYKVSVTADEVFSMTPDEYQHLCSSPRNLMHVEPPKFSPDMALIYSMSSDKCTAQAVKRKNKKAQVGSLKRFGGNWPVTLERIMAGEGLKDDAGFNHVALQIAITGGALGKTTEQILEGCAGFLENHQGDGDRYDTPSKRREEMRRMCEYAADSPVYDYSLVAIHALMTPEAVKKSDLGLGDYPVGQTPAGVGNSTEAPPPEEEGDGSLVVDHTGIYTRVDGNLKRLSDIGIDDITVMRKGINYLGFELVVHLDGKRTGERHAPMSAFSSRSSFNSWTLNQGASMSGTDILSSKLADLLRKRASAKPGGVVYAVEREGVDVVVPPGCEDKSQIDVIWASTEGVISMGETQYKFHGIRTSEGYADTDLMSAPDLAEEDRGFVEDLLTINTEENLAKMLGWFASAFFCQLIRRELKQFPLLQIFGQAESGKSASVELLNGLHYYMKKPRQLSASGQTMFPIINAVGSSASIPVVFDEMKPRQMRKDHKDTIQNIFRSNYRSDVISRGGLSRDKAQKDVVVTDYSNAAPIAFMGEGIEDQAAILGRCVVVSMSKADRMGRSPQFERCVEECQTMGKIGRMLATVALSTAPKDVADIVRGYLKKINDDLTVDAENDNKRPTFNLAVAATGLEYIRGVLQLVYGTYFNEKIESLQEKLLTNVYDKLPRNLSEASRVLDTMGLLSRSNDVRVRLERNVDYTVSEDGEVVDIKLRNAYAKYTKYQRELGAEVLFDTESAFITGMFNYAGVIKRACPDNEILWDNPKAVVFRFDAEYLSKEGVTPFKD